MKGKFLEGRRNRRLDHLLHVLVDRVLPYYLFEERRQKLGFEGENLENQKRVAIVRNSQSITADDIKYQGLQQTDSTYLVKAASQPGHWYEANILAYTCTCPDYPVIQFCKHLHAVQTLFPQSDLTSSQQLDNLSTGGELQVPTTSNSDKRKLGLGLSVSIPGTEDSASKLGSDLDTLEASSVLCNVAEKLERFVVHFRLHGTPDQAKRLDAWIDHELSLEATTLSLLPTKQKLSPRLNSWPETQAAMMPAKKTRPKRAGDQAYGAGESSGKKAKLLPKPVAAESGPLVNTHPIANSTQAQVLPANDPHIQIPAPPHPPSTSNYYRPKTHLY